MNHLLFVAVLLISSSVYTSANTIEDANAGCVCSMEWKPVCGSNGRTYGNSCELKCASKSDPSLRAVALGECEQKPDQAQPSPPKPVALENTAQIENPTCICPKSYIPVCGSNMVTYSNLCQLNCAQERSDVQFIKAGQC